MNVLSKSLLIPAIVSASIIVALFIVRGIVIYFLKKWNSGTSANIRVVILKSLRTPSIFWCLAVGLYVTIGLSELPRKYVVPVDQTIYILLIFSITIAIANLAVKAFESYTQRPDINIPATGIILGVFKLTIIIAGMLVILNYLGVSIAPLLTALGVGGLAVALALKDTLSNLFAGLHIIASRQVRPGDYIKLNSGEEGTVTDITWRSTTITSKANNIIIIPNAHVASAIITNYEFPDREMSLSVQLTAPLSADLDRIEAISCEAARVVVRTMPGAVPDTEPLVRFETFTDAGIGFSVNVKIKDFASLRIVRHNLIKALHNNYVQEGIVIPSSTKNGK